MSNRPLITAVMVTGMHRARYALARVAIDCFLRQTYSNKELLIINHGPSPLANGHPSIRELRVDKAAHETVADLRNIGLREARGEFLICWDDDDWYAPERLAVQFEAQRDGAPVLLRAQIRLNLLNGCACYEEVRTGIAGTILHPRAGAAPYPRMVRGSDFAFMTAFRRAIVLDNDPALYVRTYHGLNLWDAEHIMHEMADPAMKDQLALSTEHQSVVRQVLADNSAAYRQFASLSAGTEPAR